MRGPLTLRGATAESSWVTRDIHAFDHAAAQQSEATADTSSSSHASSETTGCHGLLIAFGSSWLAMRCDEPCEDVNPSNKIAREPIPRGHNSPAAAMGSEPIRPLKPSQASALAQRRSALSHVLNDPYPASVASENPIWALVTLPVLAWH